MNILDHIINILFPSICKQCGDPVSVEAPTAYFCNRCWDSIKWFDGPCCPCCGMPYPATDPYRDTSHLKWEVSLQEKERGTDLLSRSHAKIDLSPFPGSHSCGSCRRNPPSFDRAISAGPYEGVLAEAIKLFKYKNKVHIGRALVEQMRSLPDTLSLRERDRLALSEVEGVRAGLFSNERSPYCLIPVPLHPKRLREREFNQSAILASVIGKRLGLPVLLDVLIRQHYTRPQVELDVKERKENVTGVFAVKDAAAIKDKDLILVDDVYTTGSTVNECAKTLKRNCAGKVYVVTIARMVR